LNGTETKNIKYYRKKRDIMFTRKSLLQAKKYSLVPMSSSDCLKIVTYICVCGIKAAESRVVRVGANGLKNRAVDLQNETGVEGNLHPCTIGHHSK
jgi:hypothetical protein